MDSILILAIIVGIFCFLSTFNWRNLVIAALVLLVFEGVLRKWVLPQASDSVYFLKDFILLAAYFNYYSKSKIFPIFINRNFNQAFTKIIFLIFGLCLVQAFNPSLGSVLIGFFGIKNYLFYVPLIWMLTNIFFTKKDLYKFLRIYLLITIPVCILAIVQFFSPVDSPINVYAGGGGVETIATFGGGGEEGAARVTGTFPYISGLGIYLVASFSLLIPLLTLSQPRIWQLLNITEILLVTATSFMTGSRAVVLFEILYIAGYLAILLFNRPYIFSRAFKRFFIPALVTFLAISLFFSRSVNLFTERSVQNEEEGYTRVLSPLIEPWLLPLRIEGYGTGASHQATPKIRALLNISPLDVNAPPGNDGSSVKVMLDLGPIGLLLWDGLRLYLIFCSWHLFKQLKDPFLIQLALSNFLFQTLQFTSSLVSNPTFSLYYWFFAGFIFLLPELEQREYPQQDKVKSQIYD